MFFRFQLNKFKANTGNSGMTKLQPIFILGTSSGKAFSVVPSKFCGFGSTQWFKKLVKVK